MASQFSLPFELPPIGLLPPAADAGGRTGPYKSLRNCVGKISVVCRVNQGNAAPVTFTLLQAKDAAGTGSKAIAAVPIYYNADTTASDTLVAQVAGANYQTDAATKDKIVVFDFLAAELDVNNGFNHLAVQTSVSNAANITEASMLAKPRYAQTVPLASEV